MNILKKALLAAAIITAAGAAQATEGLAPAGPIGGTDLNQALLPPPGVYMGLVAGNVKLSDYRLGGGSKVPGRGDVNFGALGALVVYDTQLWGGQVASSIGYGKQKLCFGTYPSAKNCSEGAMDLYTDVFMWSKFTPSQAFLDQPKTGRIIPYGTAIMGALGVTWPTGEYDSAKPLNVGSNFYTFSPSIALTHTAPSIFGAKEGRATQFSARLFYNHYTKNTATDYKTGDTVSIDYSFTEISGNWTFGLAGSAWTQITDDVKGGASNNIRASAATLSPIMQYDFMLGKKPAYFKAKYTYLIGGERVTQSEGLTVSMGMKF